MNDVNFNYNKTAQHKQRAPSSKPPFTLMDLRKAIPPHCFQRSVFRSFSYIISDLTVIFILYCLAANHITALPRLLQFPTWPSYWFAQGCMMFSLWIIAHECGHHATSDYVLLDDTIGFILHSFLFVPYFSWKFSHARHHANTGSMEKDEVFVPMQELHWVWNYLNNPIGRVLYILWCLVFGLPLYLAVHLSGRSYERFTSHYDPYSPIYSKPKRFYVILSDLGILAVMCGLYHLAVAKGLLWVVKIYGIPLMVTNAWLVTVTYLHHTHPSLPHYDSSEWTWLKGAISTVDRDYGILNRAFHHFTDAHVVHHLFPSLPHYHAVEATEAIKPVLGEFYQFDDTSVPQALHQLVEECLYVTPDEHRKGVFWFRGLS